MSAASLLTMIQAVSHTGPIPSASETCASSRNLPSFAPPLRPDPLEKLGDCGSDSCCKIMNHITCATVVSSDSRGGQIDLSNDRLLLCTDLAMQILEHCQDVWPGAPTNLFELDLDPYYASKDPTLTTCVPAPPGVSSEVLSFSSRIQAPTCCRLLIFFIVLFLLVL